MCCSESPTLWHHVIESQETKSQYKSFHLTPLFSLRTLPVLNCDKHLPSAENTPPDPPLCVVGGWGPGTQPGESEEGHGVELRPTQAFSQSFSFNLTFIPMSRCTWSPLLEALRVCRVYRIPVRVPSVGSRRFLESDASVLPHPSNSQQLLSSSTFSPSFVFSAGVLQTPASVRNSACWAPPSGSLT